MCAVTADIEALNATKSRRNGATGSQNKTTQKRGVEEEEGKGEGEIMTNKKKRTKLEGVDDISNTENQQCTAEYCAPCYELA